MISFNTSPTSGKIRKVIMGFREKCLLSSYTNKREVALDPIITSAKYLVEYAEYFVPHDSCITEVFKKDGESTQHESLFNRHKTMTHTHPAAPPTHTSHLSQTQTSRLTNTQKSVYTFMSDCVSLAARDFAHCVRQKWLHYSVLRPGGEARQFLGICFESQNGHQFPASLQQTRHSDLSKSVVSGLVQ